MLLRLLLLTIFLIVGIVLKPSNGVLLFPKNTVLQITIGVSMPIEKNDEGGVVFSLGFQFNYILPWNLSQLESTILSTSRIRDLGLQDLYTSLERTIDERGWKNGKECLLRTICELATIPLDKTDSDVMSKIIYLFFTPSEDSPNNKLSSSCEVDDLYLNAEQAGKSGDNCTRIYPDCAYSLLDLFTRINSS